METIYLSQSAQVAEGTFFMKYQVIESVKKYILDVLSFLFIFTTDTLNSLNWAKQLLFLILALKVLTT